MSVSAAVPAARDLRLRAVLGVVGILSAVALLAWQQSAPGRARRNFEDDFAPALAAFRQAQADRTLGMARDLDAMARGHAVLRTILSTASLADADLGFPNFNSPRDSLSDANLRMRSLLPALPTAHDSDVFAVADAQGRLLFSKADPHEFGADLSGATLLRETLESGRGLAVWSAAMHPDVLPGDPHPALYEVVGQSVEFGDEIHGVVLIGSRLDREALADLRGGAGPQLLLVDSQGLVASTFDDRVSGELSRWAPLLEPASAADGRVIEGRVADLSFVASASSIAPGHAAPAPSVWFVQPIDAPPPALGALALVMGGLGSLAVASALLARRANARLETSLAASSLPDAALRHAQVKEIFTAISELPPNEHDRFLEEACADDPGLRSQVEALLAHHEPETLGMAAPVAASRSPRFETGSTFAGRYRIVSALGSGGAGDVYRADDMTLGVPVALKFLKPDGFARVDSLLSEVRLARQVSHPNVCRVFDVGEAEGEVFLSMEYIEGEDLASQLARFGRLPATKALELARDLCAGLAAAHEQGVLHRDLKPGNIMVDERGRARIVDFGIAVREGIEGAVPAGTPAYMAPEQLEAGGQITEQTDLYALGLVLYELVTGRSRFEGGGLEELRALHRTAEPVSISDFAPEIPAEFEAVILQALREDPRERPASALAMARALDGPGTGEG